MKKLFKSLAFALIATMVLTALPSFAINTRVITPVDIKETYETEALTGWSAASGTEYAAKDGALNFIFPAGGGKVIKEINDANLNVFANFDFYVGDYTGTLAITLKNAKGATITEVSVAENGTVNGTGVAIKKGEWNRFSSSMRLAIGDGTVAINGNILFAETSLSAKSEISAIEFTASANAQLSLDNFTLSNVKNIETKQTNMTTAIESGIFNVTNVQSSSGTYADGFTAGDLNRNIMTVNFPAITDKGVIELDIWIAGDGNPLTCFGFGQGSNTHGGIISYNTTLYYCTPGSWTPCNLSWNNSSSAKIRAEIDLEKQEWKIYALDKNSGGELTYRETLALNGSVEYIDTLTIDTNRVDSHFYFGSVKVESNTGMELDDKSITAFPPETGNAKLVLATYASDKMIDVKFLDMTKVYVNTFKELGLKTEGAAIVKAFMLDGDDNITPIGNVESKLFNEKSLKRLSENTEDNVVMFVGSKEVYVSNLPETLAAPVYKKNNTVMYPLEQVCKGVGCEYSDSNGTISLVTQDGTKATVWLGKTTSIIGGQSVDFTVAPEKINGEIFVPEIILTKAGMKIFKNAEGLIAVSGSEKTLATEGNAEAEINYLTALYTADDVAEDAIQLYVATDGDDSAAGTIDAPLGTFEGARQKVRSIKANGMTTDIAVNFRGGTYYIDSTVELGELDSGISGHRVIYRNFENETAEFIVGQKLNWSDFRPILSKDISNRLDEDVRDKVKQMNLKGKYKFTKFGYSFPRLYGNTLYAPMELYVNSKAQTLARYPNEGFINCESVVKAGSRFVGTGGDGTLSDPAIISFAEDEPLTWQHSNDIYLYGQWDWGWVTNEQKPFIDKTNKQMTLKYMSFGVTKASGTRYYYKNVLEELDSPGEYYIDRNTGILYLYPDGDLSDADIVVTKMLDGTEIDEWDLALNVASGGASGVPQSEVDAANAKYTIISFNNASHITLDGLNFKYTAGNVMTIKGGYNLLIKNCDISCAGIRAIDINGGYDHVIKNCRMQELGGGGVNIVNAGDRTTLTSSGIKVENCEILNYDLLTGGYAGAVYVDGVGVTVRNNRMAGSKHFAVGFYGNDHVIQNNDISDVLQISDDAGAIYSYNDVSYWNNDISYNYFHDTKRAFHFSNDGGEAGLTHNLVAAIYLDNYISGTRCVGNLAENFGSYMTFVHAGGSNDINNNVYVSTGDKNVVTSIIAVTGCSDTVYGKNNSTLYRQRYPDMAKMIDEGVLGTPAYNKVNRNVVYAKGTWSSGFDIPNWSSIQQSGNIIRNSASASSPFVNTSEQDYRLASASDFANTFGSIDNAADYANMGLSADYPFANRDEDIKRLFIKSDKFNSGVANYDAAKGETIQLEVIARGESGYVLNLNDVRYASSNSNIASVDSNGLVTVLADGAAKITATAIKNGKIKTIYININ